MEESDLGKFIRKNFTDKNFVKAFLTSFLSFLILLVIILGISWHFRAKLFGYFAEEYLQEAQNGGNKNDVQATEKILEKQAIFSQEHFVIDAVKKTNPAVVSIIISKEVPKYETYIDPNQQTNPFGDMFPGFSFNIPQYRQNGTEKKDIGGGSGFFVTSDGLIVTNKHVVDTTGATHTVFTNDGKKHDAKVIARDPVLDIALIKVEGSGFPYLSLGDSDSLEIGQSVIAIGNALGEYRNTVSVGVVSGLARSITAGDNSGGSEVLDHVIQTDAAINPGNSGGPLLNISGQVIGVNVAIAQGSQNIGFALPINSVKGAIDSVKSTGKIVRAYLGVRYVAIDAQLQQKNNLTVDYGVLVKAGTTAADLAVIPGSPADKAGIVENDIILEVDGVKLDDKTSLASVIRGKSIGQVIKLKILHKGVEKTVPVTLEAAKDSTN
ncbi:MAG TPA: trypsin-like peptidase domain-containing protein [Candidatus Paceibacterota bacterium]|nr:trypsin-like peptidase domain-containing protein [Candidatus Paceibacterota bacterium]